MLFQSFTLCPNPPALREKAALRTSRTPPRTRHRKRQGLVLTAVATAALLGAVAGSAVAQPAETQTDKAQPANQGTMAPDNTGVNQGNNANYPENADQAGESDQDREAMQKIRKAIMEDENISTYGHNVKIIANNGHITLKGSVRSAAEKRKIAAKAVAVVGHSNVTNRLRVMHGKKSHETPKKSDESPDSHSDSQPGYPDQKSLTE